MASPPHKFKSAQVALRLFSRTPPNLLKVEVNFKLVVPHNIRNPELFNLNHSFITILFTELIATV